LDDRYRQPLLERTAILYPGRLEPQPPRRRAPWGRRLKAGIGILLAIAVIGTAAGLFYVHDRLGDVRRVSPNGLTPASGAMTVLLVGSDSRADLTPGQEVHFGSSTQVSGKRSDAIMVLRSDPSRNRAAVLSIPRDLYVPIAGTGRSNRINVAYAGGPERLIQTLESALGISINHYVEVNFDGFRGIVDAVGGLNVFFPAPARDILAELNVPSAGCVHLTGDQGLAYVRSRQYEYLENGRWRSDPTGDHGRIQRQQDFIRRMLSKAVSRGMRNPITANNLLTSFVRDVTVDHELGTLDLVRLAATMRSFGSGGVEMLTLPTTGARIGGNSVLRMKQPEASQLIDRFLNPPPPADPSEAGVEPSSVRIRVLNGSGRPGEAGQAAGKLERAGFRLAGTGDASNRASSTVIRYPKGAAGKAQLLQGFVVGGAELRADSSLEGSDLVLVTGRSFGGIRAPAAAAAAPASPQPAPAQPECPT
jgi:LCP family protein required for cell wall assembly